MEWLLAFGVVWLLLVAAALTLSAPARRADEGAQRILARERVMATLDRLRSPSGRRFFPSDRERQRLVSDIEELHGP